MRLIQRVNTNEELDEKESAKSTDFGYDLLKWYYIRIWVNNNDFKIYYNKIGNPQKLIMEQEDDDLVYGYMGLTTSATKAVFDELMLRPIVEEKRYTFVESEIPPWVNPDLDV